MNYQTFELGDINVGLLDGLMGNASEVNIADVQKEYAQILANNESIEKAYKLIRDMFIFTNKRLILVDKQGITGRKIEYHSIPYKSISHFSIETAGNFDLDAELKIWVSGSAVPIQKQFNKNLNIYQIQSVLAEYILD
nr:MULTISPECIES: PH domain-containing protein [unclassified Brevibacillus]